MLESYLLLSDLRLDLFHCWASLHLFVSNRSHPCLHHWSSCRNPHQNRTLLLLKINYTAVLSNILTAEKIGRYIGCQEDCLRLGKTHMTHMWTVSMCPWQQIRATPTTKGNTVGIVMEPKIALGLNYTCSQKALCAILREKEAFKESGRA